MTPLRHGIQQESNARQHRRVQSVMHERAGPKLDCGKCLEGRYTFGYKSRDFIGQFSDDTRQIRARRNQHPSGDSLDGCREAKSENFLGNWLLRLDSNQQPSG